MRHRRTRREEHARYAREHGFGAAEWRALGTGVHLLVSDRDRLEAGRVGVEEVLRRIDEAASRFRADSELSRINGTAGTWQPVSRLLCQALRVALDVADWTDGLVDPTVGATLVDLGYDRTFALVTKDGAPLVKVRSAPGWQGVELDDEQRRVRVPPGTVIDLGASGKGLAADLASEAAAEATGCGILVNLGGDLSVAGDSPDGGWAITVGDTASLDVPLGAEAEEVVRIDSGGLATSSTRARRWRRGGSDLHHLIDPRLGRPSEGNLRTVSVAASTCALANAASTAAIILDQEAPAWLEQQGLPARLVRQDGTVRRVAGWPAAGGAG